MVGIEEPMAVIDVPKQQRPERSQVRTRYP
jgi:hypothetical protein